MTNNQSPTPPVRVEQVDRERAASTHARPATREAILRGDHDESWLVQLLATHRQSGIDAGLAMGAEIARGSGDAAAAFITNDLDSKLADDQLDLWQRASLYVASRILAARTERGEDNPPAPETPHG